MSNLVHRNADRKNKHGRKNNWKVISVMILLSFFIGIPLQSGAAAAADWDAALDTIHNLYGSYSTLQDTLKEDTLKIQTLRKQNNAELKAIKAQLQAVDQALLTRLKTAADTIRKKHAPLLEQYTALGQQATAARKAKDIKRATMLDLKRNKLKTAAAAARAEVKKAAEALAAARKLTAGKIQPAKNALTGIPALKKQIKESGKELSTAQKIRSEADKGYKAGVKQGDAVSAAAQLKLSFSQMGLIHNLQQKIYDWEKRIAVSLGTAKSKLPK
ncbi:hypothetical protein [Paenibacillus albidus]|nr:hypothetical protein [Paenibacillus albidus]